jgi:ABC-type branched-subunit amino acid transport system substrate-binding protein
MRTWRAVTLVLVAGLIASACGARLTSAERQQAANAILNGNGGGGAVATTGPPSSGGPVTGPTGGPVTGPSTGPGASTGPVTGPSQGGPSTGPTTQAGGSTCPTSGTDVGLTSNSVTIGTIASTSGPVSGLFQGAQQGIQAFRAFMNSQGGLCGHSVTDDFADDGTNCGQNQNDTQDLGSKVFAFVGSFSLYDGCGASYFDAHPSIADLHVQLDPRVGQEPSNFDIEPGPLGYATGMFAYYRQKLGAAVKAVGTLYPDIPSAAEKQKGFVHAANSEGWKFVYSRAAAAQESDWQTDFVKMCQSKHIKIFFTSAENAANAAKMLQDEDSANCPKTLINIIPIAYDQAFVQDAGSSPRLQGLLGWNEYSLFFNKDEAQRIPELQLLQSWFQRANGNAPLNLYALFAWAEGRLFEQGFEHAGSTINRQSLVAALHKIHSFDANGIVAPNDPNPSKTSGVHCYILWKYSGSAFSRVDDPTTGFRCDGKFLPLNG